MISIANISDKSADRLIGLFHELLDGLPQGVATVGSGRTKKDDGAVVWLKPSKPFAAEFSAHIEDGNPSLIDVSFGSGTTFELPWQSKFSEDASFDEILETVRAMGLATIAGRCQEYLGFIGIRGTIKINEGNVLRSSSFFHPRLLPKLVRYKPYV